MVILAVFLLGIAVGMVIGVAIAVREQKLDDYDRLFAHHFAEDLAEEAEVNRLFDQDR